MEKRKILRFLLILFLVACFWEAISSKDRITEEENIMNNLTTFPEKKLRVAIMADIHSDSEQFEKMLFKAKDNGVDLVIVAGDLVERDDKRDLIEIKKILDKSELKYAVIPGDREKNLDNFTEIFGNDYQIVEMERVKFILINNAFWRGLGEAQKKWIEENVSDCHQKICLVVMHKALNNLFSVKIMGEGNEKVAAEAEWLKELLIVSGVKRIVAADLHYSTSYELEGLRTDIVGAISREDNLQSSRYTELMISGDSIERKVVEAEDDIGN